MISKERYCGNERREIVVSSHPFAISVRLSTIAHFRVKPISVISGNLYLFKTNILTGGTDRNACAPF